MLKASLLISNSNQPKPKEIEKKENLPIFSYNVNVFIKKLKVDEYFLYNNRLLKWKTKEKLKKNPK